MTTKQIDTDMAYTDILNKHFNTLNRLKNNKYLLKYYKACTVYFISNRFSAFAREYIKEHFNAYRTRPDLVCNALVLQLYPCTFEPSKKEVQNAIKTIKQYINNYKKYN